MPISSRRGRPEIEHRVGVAAREACIEARVYEQALGEVRGRCYRHGGTVIVENHDRRRIGMVV